MFLPIGPATPDVQPGIPYSAMRDVTPLIDRPAPFMWRGLFHRACAASPDLDWQGAGFARCTPDQVERVTERLADITRSTNEAFANHLAEAAPAERARLLEEGINIVSDDEPGTSYGIPFPGAFGNGY